VPRPITVCEDVGVTSVAIGDAFYGHRHIDESDHCGAVLQGKDVPRNPDRRADALPCFGGCTS
jgi:hypothetical protein